ncbi:MAG: tyrosine-type recombinase/integrase [Sulfobacillus sp.]|nr:tyrosine-type recombinase/integrase [Sulfobacillus sp.]
MPPRAKDPYAVTPRQLPSGRWKGRVVLYDPETGKRREVTQTFDTKREAKAWAETEAAKYREDPNRKPPSEETLEEFVATWLATMQPPRIRPTTWRAYEQKLRYAVEALGTRRLRDLTTQDIQRFYADLGQRVSARTVTHVHRVLAQALSDAEDWNLIPRNPARRAKPPRVVDPDLHVPTIEESRQLLRAVEGHRLRALWIWLVFTGTRRGEALGLRWSDIDWERRQAVIRQALTGEARTRALGPVKTRTGVRVIDLPDVVMQALRQHRQQQRLERLAAGSAWANADDLVFTTRLGKWLDPQNVYRDFKTVLRKAGLPATIRLHDLRHAMATQWLAAGVPIKVVAERLGHSDVGFTLRVYGHVLAGQQAEAAAQMEAILLGDGPQTGRRNFSKHDKPGETSLDKT